MIIRNLSFENVTINGEAAAKVGVIAAVDNGANVANVSINTVNVNISGQYFGTFFGSSAAVVNHAIVNPHVENVIADSVRYVIAGGVVGYSSTNILGTQDEYAFVTNIKFNANYFGGVAGINKGAIKYVIADEISFSQAKTLANISAGGIYSGEANIADATGGIYIGAIAGRNEMGAIENVYCRVTIDACSGAAYKLYLGGVTGLNREGNIHRAYVVRAAIRVSESYSSFVGGVVGFNYAGSISNTVVAGGYVDTAITSSAATTNVGDKKVLSYQNCSIVGGIAGYDYALTNAIYSIVNCVNKIELVKGFYAGGLVGLSFGNINHSYVGNSDAENGGVTINGFIASGLVGIIGAGSLKDCYSISKVIVASTGVEKTEAGYVDANGNAVDAESVFSLDCSAGAGIAVFVRGNAVVKGNYAYVHFEGKGLVFGAIAHIDEVGEDGIGGNVYVEGDADITIGGTKLSAGQITGETDSYVLFRNSIDSDNISIWTLSEDAQTNPYPPIFENIDTRNPNSELPASR